VGQIDSFTARVIKYDAAGNTLWVRDTYSTYGAQGNGVASDVAGIFLSPARLSTQTQVIFMSSNMILLETRFGFGMIPEGFRRAGVAVDFSGNIFVTGYYLDYSPNLTSYAHTIKYDVNGNIL